MSWSVLEGDAREALAGMPDGWAQACVTSPPYYGLRDYGVEGQIGHEETPDAYVARLVEAFREVRRVLRDDGTLWLNLGDSYASGNRAYYDHDPMVRGRSHSMRPDLPPGVKPKDLLGIPWMVAFALRADGWYLRQEIVWAKANPMPESVADRPTRAHEQVFLLSKRPRYFYDRLAVLEDTAEVRAGEPAGGGRNCRSVWNVPTQPYPGAHYAVFPPRLVEPCLLAGTPPASCSICGAPRRRDVQALRTFDGEHVPDAGSWAAAGAPRRIRPDGAGHWRWRTVYLQNGWLATCGCGAPDGEAVVVDPFCGSGTTGMVALRLGRSFVGIDLDPSSAELARERIIADAPLLNSATESAPQAVSGPLEAVPDPEAA